MIVNGLFGWNPHRHYAPNISFSEIEDAEVQVGYIERILKSDDKYGVTLRNWEGESINLILGEQTMADLCEIRGMSSVEQLKDSFLLEAYLDNKKLIAFCVDLQQENFY